VNATAAVAHCPPLPGHPAHKNASRSAVRPSEDEDGRAAPRAAS